MQFRFLSYCWTLPNYGSAFFQASVPSNNVKQKKFQDRLGNFIKWIFEKKGKFDFVHVCINGLGVHLLNRQTRVLEIFYPYQEIVWRVHYSPDSIEICSKRTNQSLFLYTKQNNLINHLMNSLDSQLHWKIYRFQT